ncbi:MAG: class II aldolase/adducin family protein [Bradymonadia bacterium]
MAPFDEIEGVTKFTPHHTPGPLSPEASALAPGLIACRQRMYARGLVGLDPARYGGVGYGNLSCRLPGGGFLVTGTGTGGLDTLGPEHLCEIIDFDLESNSVTSTGPVAPSSESMTHGALYEAAPEASAIIHIHGPLLWAHSDHLEVMVTAPGVAYGTPQMGREVERLLDAGFAQPLIKMTGHEHGFLAFGPTFVAAQRVLEQADIQATKIADAHHGAP